MIRNRVRPSDSRPGTRQVANISLAGQKEMLMPISGKKPGSPMVIRGASPAALV